MSSIEQIRADLKKDDERFMALADDYGIYEMKGEKMKGEKVTWLILRYSPQVFTDLHAVHGETLKQLEAERGKPKEFSSTAWIQIVDREGKDLLFPLNSIHRESSYRAFIWD